MKIEVGQDIQVNGKFGEISEICSSGNIVVEYPNKTREVVLKKYLNNLTQLNIGETIK